MSSLHSMKKEIAKNTLMFQPDMYNNLLGSVVISAYILSDDKTLPVVINGMWNKIKKHPKLVDFWLDDPNFIDKTLDLFAMKRPDYFPVAMVQSEFNVLIMPYINDQLFPLREDGVYPLTAKKGKIYPISFTNNTCGTDEELAKCEGKEKCQEEENLVQTQVKQPKQVKHQKQ